MRAREGRCPMGRRGCKRIKKASVKKLGTEDAADFACVLQNAVEMSVADIRTASFVGGE